ncbi:hypothetical protein JCM18904_962 [Vibrio sp. JCM 18904]|nr:hypothetical protein JCM18904_962 [Vibrio sp. JCM 18904]
MSDKINVKDKILCTCHSILVLVSFLSHPKTQNALGQVKTHPYKRACVLTQRVFQKRKATTLVALVN